MIRRDYSSAFPLPNGHCLRYASPWDKGNQCQWFRTTVSGLPQVKRSTTKSSLFKAGLWSSGSDIHLIAADFDELPDGFGSFDLLRQYLRINYRGRLITSSSYSGKVKSFIPVVLSESTRMTIKIALSTLEYVLWDKSYDLYRAVDKSYSALSTTYLTNEIIAALKEIDSFPVTEAVEEEGDQDGVLYKKSKPNIPLRRYQGIIPMEFTDWLKNRSDREEFLRILLVTPHLCTESGFQIPQTYFGDECDVSQAAIHKWIKSLVNHGWLEKLSDEYHVGRRSKNYVARGSLYDAISGNLQPSGFFEIPNEPIKDGNWNSELFRGAFLFQNKPVQVFLAYVSSLPGANKKNRMKMARWAIQQRKRYLERKSYTQKRVKKGD